MGTMKLVTLRNQLTAMELTLRMKRMTFLIPSRVMSWIVKPESTIAFVDLPNATSTRKHLEPWLSIRNDEDTTTEEGEEEIAVAVAAVVVV